MGRPVSKFMDEVVPSFIPFLKRKSRRARIVPIDVAPLPLVHANIDLIAQTTRVASTETDESGALFDETCTLYAQSVYSDMSIKSE